MKRLYSDTDTLRLGHLKSVLEAQGIKCLVQNEALSFLEGEIPLSQTWPELWVEDGRFEEAQGIVQEYLGNP